MYLSLGAEAERKLRRLADELEALKAASTKDKNFDIGQKTNEMYTVTAVLKVGCGQGRWHSHSHPAHRAQDVNCDVAAPMACSRNICESAAPYAGASAILGQIASPLPQRNLVSAEMKSTSKRRRVSQMCSRQPHVLPVSPRWLQGRCSSVPVQARVCYFSEGAASQHRGAAPSRTHLDFGSLIHAVSCSPMQEGARGPVHFSEGAAGQHGAGAHSQTRPGSGCLADLRFACDPRPRRACRT